MYFCTIRLRASCGRAETIVAALPQLVLSLMVQKYIVRGLTMGAVR